MDRRELAVEVCKRVMEPVDDEILEMSTEDIEEAVLIYAQAAGFDYESFEEIVEHSFKELKNGEI